MDNCLEYYLGAFYSFALYFGYVPRTRYCGTHDGSDIPPFGRITSDVVIRYERNAVPSRWDIAILVLEGNVANRKYEILS